MNNPILTRAAKTALATIHPDPFVQAAAWRLYWNAPLALDVTTRFAIARALDVVVYVEQLTPTETRALPGADYHYADDVPTWAVCHGRGARRLVLAVLTSPTLAQGIADTLTTNDVTKEA